jgi:hypothetical protein
MKNSPTEVFDLVWNVVETIISMKITFGAIHILLPWHKLHVILAASRQNGMANPESGSVFASTGGKEQELVSKGTQGQTTGLASPGGMICF